MFSLVRWFSETVEEEKNREQNKKREQLSIPFYSQITQLYHLPLFLTLLCDTIHP